MNLRFYEILSTLIPGFLIFIVIFDPNETHISSLSMIAIAFLIGYINNTISSWLESILYMSWGGKPSDKLLKGEDIRKVRFLESGKIKELIGKNEPVEKDNNDLFFEIAKRKTSILPNTRIREFNEMYVFSRSILVSVLIISLIINVRYWMNWLYIMTSVLVIIICWVRAKQRAYYYAREVLNSYLSNYS